MTMIKGAQARAIRAAVNAKIDDPQRWKGKKCRLHLAFAKDGTALAYQPATAIKPIARLYYRLHKSPVPGLYQPGRLSGFSEIRL
jgi:colicin import membrane protein